MRFPYLALLVVTLAGAGTFWYQTTASICPVPLGYRLGTLGTEFNLSPEQAKAHLAKAEAVWEKEAGRELFVYDEQATLLVDFVFDERQALADTEVNTRQILDEQKLENEKLFTKIEELQKDYEARSNGYKREVTLYEAHLTEYNDKVGSYNDRGGAPSEVFAELEREKSALAKESVELNQTADELNEMAEKINQLGAEANQLVETYNREVETYNDQFGYSREFTQGDYHGDRINIYKFSNETELESVLVHEFGHALGIDHVEGESSVMYYLLGDTRATPELTREDKEAFVAVCGQRDEWEYKVRRFVRSVLSTLNIYYGKLF